MTILASISAGNQPAQPAPLVPAPGSQAGYPSFQDVLDTVNPLEHIPVVSGLYRAVTGTTISTGAKLAGDTAYSLLLGGGVAGLAVSVGSTVADAVSTALSGSDVSANVVKTVTSAPSSGTSLVPDSGQAAVVNALYSSQPASSRFYALGGHPTSAVAAGEYQRAQIDNTFDKKLIQMI